MGKIKRYKNVVERFLSGESGQRFFNIAYSVGAAIVILGALFKILHLRGGDLLLSIGMGTEVLMFLLTAFDRPPRESSIEELLPYLSGTGNAGSVDSAGTATPIAKSSISGISGQPSTGGTVIVGGGMNGMSPEVARELEKLGETAARLNAAGEALLGSMSSVSADPTAAAEGAAGYVEQMKALNRNIQGLNTIYEIQLHSVSTQLDAIQSVNSGMSRIKEMYQQTTQSSEAYREEADKLAQNMKQLNKVYEQMLKAMTVNMYNNAPQVSGND